MDKTNILQELLSKIEVLSLAVDSARERLESSEFPNKEQWLSRMDQYTTMTLKQKELITQLQESSTVEEFDRIVGIINGLSIMMRDDAVEVVEFITGKRNEVSHKDYN